MFSGDRPLTYSAKIRLITADRRDVAILIEVGNENLRYLTGYAVAVHAEKPAVYVNISSIVDKAREEFGADVNITEAKY